MDRRGDDALTQVGQNIEIVELQVWKFFDRDDDGIVRLASDEVPAAPRTDVARGVHNAIKLCPSGALRLVPE